MIGGNVVETIVLPDRVWVNCRERNCTSTCAIYVENTSKSRSISEGDIVWWQGGYAMWTPKRNGKSYGKSDIQLNRIGCSGVIRPESKGD